MISGDESARLRFLREARAAGQFYKETRKGAAKL
jgi:hypothetical protein